MIRELLTLLGVVRGEKHTPVCLSFVYNRRLNPVNYLPVGKKKMGVHLSFSIPQVDTSPL